ncbi:Flp family type IVb pilin [Comamonas terrigena]|uniref:Flp family type IVb pilin n=1 Tax=Comamonas terrigena TaxID=32013 RepID=UPI002446BA19|nr:Flp family type IVb pilin [Comamonas terrigena]MDH0048068.1 Flp family type IVb pilin [Comamonas terrigena]MDH0510332.1 Flp family type IVb pilin [Comamonas terrigena]MDH1089934.1 Flp family type IVb pilin [Comamonas terrigena]MDH1291836.1 Flp family type IVb pilin [Comamonas terrigena]MDH1499806.1 Flp family type IVb pilin [Comamonas terrigena]
MSHIAHQFGNSLLSFVRDEEGAQVVEYALIIAVVSIALVIALRALTEDDGGFGTFIGRVSACLTGGTCE